MINNYDNGAFLENENLQAENRRFIKEKAFTEHHSEPDIVSDNHLLKERFGESWIDVILEELDDSEDAYYAIETIGSETSVNDLKSLSLFFTNSYVISGNDRGARTLLPLYFENSSKLSSLTEEDRNDIKDNIEDAIGKLTNEATRQYYEDGDTDDFRLSQMDIFDYVKHYAIVGLSEGADSKEAVLLKIEDFMNMDNMAFNEYLTVEVQRIYDAIERQEDLSALGFNYVRSNDDAFRRYEAGIVPKTLQKIEKESIKKIIETSNQTPEEQSWIRGIDDYRTQVAIKVADEFYAILSSGGNGDKKIFTENEISFLNAAHKELLEIPENIDPRIIKSQISSLHSLIFSGGLERLYENYLKDPKNKLLIETNQITELDVKTELAAVFLDRVNMKNQEETAVDIPSGLISVGIEIEYNNFIRQEMLTKKIYEEIVESFNQMILNAKHKVEIEVYEKMKKKIERRLEIINSIVKDNDPSLVAENFDRWEPGVKGALLLDIITGRSNSEIQSKPSSSFKTQLREVVNASQLGGVRDSWGVHETFGGVELSREHTEFMDALPMVIAAGFVDFEVPDELRDNPHIGYATFLEKYSKDDDGGSYFPFHKPRVFDILTLVASKAQKSGVELRSLPQYKQNSFVRFVKQLSFHYLFAHGVKSVQKEELERIDQDRELILAYEDLMHNWKELLATKGLTLPQNEDKYISSEKIATTDNVDGEESESEKIKSTNKYIVFLGHMDNLAAFDKEFSKQTRKIIRNYNKRTKQILGLDKTSTSAN